MNVRDGPWSCVYDEHTGLLWEVKSDNEGAHYAASTYFWEMPDEDRGGGCVLAPHKVIPCDRQFLLTHINTKQLCGHSDWRVPTENELVSLLAETGYPGTPFIEVGFFPHTGREAYWSADLKNEGKTSESAIIVHFGTGERQWISTQQVARLRLVRGPD